MLFLKYLVISGSALLLDLSIFGYLTRNHIFPTPMSATVSYAIGSVAAYLFLINSIFKSRRQMSNNGKEYLFFIASGILGSSMTYLSTSIILFLIDGNKWAAKLPAAGLSFCLVFWFRTKYVFPNKN